MTLAGAIGVPRHRRRKSIDRMMTAAMILAVLLAILPLGLILIDVIRRGIGLVSWGFLTQPEPFAALSAGGGFGAGIRGTIKIVGLASLLSIPVGILTAIYLVEYGAGGMFAPVVRFLTDVMSGVPSIFVGIFIYTAVVLQTGSFSTTAGSLALAILMLPIITRSSEEVLKLVPRDLVEASAALGAPRWRTVLTVVLPAARPGLTTGALLAIARAAGETAPVLLTMLGNQIVVPWQTWNGPETTLTLQVYQSSNSPFMPSQHRAWTGALILVAGVLLLSIIARLITRRGDAGRP
jgi:phosphate transport system permease protein